MNTLQLNAHGKAKTHALSAPCSECGSTEGMLRDAHPALKIPMPDYWSWSSVHCLYCHTWQYNERTR